MKIKNFFLLILVSTFTKVYAANTDQQQQDITTHIYPDVAIRSVMTYSVNIPKNALSKLIIYHVILQTNPVDSTLFKVPKITAPIWTISADNLHVPVDACLEIDATQCNDFSKVYQEGHCFDTYITSGPEFVAYDEKAQKLYLDAGNDAGGTGGMPYFLFVADINKKQINYLNTFDGPSDASLSPNGTYLALSGGNGFQVYDIHTGQFFNFSERDTGTKGHEYVHHVGSVHWLNNFEFTFKDGTYADNFQDKAETLVEKIFNIQTKKIETIKDLSIQVSKRG